MNPSDELAGVGFAGDQCHRSRFGGLEGRIADIKTKVALARLVVGSVAFEAMLGEDRSDLGGEIGAARWVCCQVKTQAQSQCGPRNPPTEGSRF